jgi:hypothetical protein
MKKARFTEEQSPTRCAKPSRARRPRRSAASSASARRSSTPGRSATQAWGSSSCDACGSSRTKIAASSRWSPISPWTNRCSRRCCKEGSEARPPARDRRRAVGGVSREPAASVRTGQLPPRDVLLPRQAAGSDAAADAAARAGRRAAAVRLSTAVHPAPAGGVARESQTDLPAVARAHRWRQRVQGHLR